MHEDRRKPIGLLIIKVAAIILLFTILSIFGAATGFFIPNQRSDSLLVESLTPVIAAGVFSLVTGFVAGGEPGGLLSGALGGAANALVNLGLLYTVLVAKDRHFVAIGGRTLAAWLPVATVAGGLLGLLGGTARRARRQRR